MDYYGRFDLVSAVLPNLNLLGTIKFASIALPFYDIVWQTEFASSQDIVSVIFVWHLSVNGPTKKKKENKMTMNTSGIHISKYLDVWKN